MKNILCSNKVEKFWTFKKQILFFRAILGLQQNWVESTESFSVAPEPAQVYSSAINILCKSGTSVTIHEPILIHHCYPKFTVYIRVHSWYCMFYEFSQLYCVMTCTHHYHKICNSFTDLKLSCNLMIYPSLPKNSCNH